ALAAVAMADGAGRGPDRGRGGRGRRRGGNRHRGVPGRNGAAVVVVQPAGGLVHDGIAPEARGVVLELLLQIAGVEAGEAGDADAVAHAVEAVATEAGVGRAAVAAAHGDDLAVGREGPVGAVSGGGAGRGREEQTER